MPLPAIAKQREIIDRRALAEALAALAEDASPERQAVVALLRAALSRGRGEIQRRFEAGGKAGDCVAEQSFLIDQLIRTLFDFVSEHVYPLANPTEGEKLAIVAVGGYGRGEMAPYSDVDLLFLLPYKQTPHTEQVVEYLLYLLWDLRLKVGHATRSIAECLRYAKTDLTIRTALLEARYIWGDQTLFAELKTKFDNEIVKGSAVEFVEQKLAERDERHKKVGDSRYQLEPNVKEGKGGLRDLHTLYWLAKYIYRIDDVAKLVELKVLSAEEFHRFARAQEFLWTVRCHLHFIAGRAEERLTFPLQSEIGERMGYRDRAGQPRRRTLHEALFPRRQGCRRSHPHLLRRPRGRPEGAAAVRLVAALERPQKHPERVHPRWRAADHSDGGFFQKGPGGTAASLSCRAGAWARHSSPCAQSRHPLAAPRRRRVARQPGS